MNTFFLQARKLIITPSLVWIRNSFQDTKCGGKKKRRTSLCCVCVFSGLPVLQKGYFFVGLRGDNLGRVAKPSSNRKGRDVQFWMLFVNLHTFLRSRNVLSDR